MNPVRQHLRHAKERVVFDSLAGAHDDCVADPARADSVRDGSDDVGRQRDQQDLLLGESGIQVGRDSDVVRNRDAGQKIRIPAGAVENFGVLRAVLPELHLVSVPAEQKGQGGAPASGSENPDSRFHAGSRFSFLEPN
jgi:hypothetical protein